MGQPQQSKKSIFMQKQYFPVSSKQQISTKLSAVNHNCVSKSLIQLSVLLKQVKFDVLTINQALLLLALTLHSMHKNTDIHIHWAHVPLVEIV